jgi:hypothetical protein
MLVYIIPLLKEKEGGKHSIWVSPFAYLVFFCGISVNRYFLDYLVFLGGFLVKVFDFTQLRFGKHIG